MANPSIVDKKAAANATTAELRKASQTSGRAKAVSYQCKVKCPRGKVGNLSELNEKIIEVMIGAKMKAKIATRYIWKRMELFRIISVSCRLPQPQQMLLRTMSRSS